MAQVRVRKRGKTFSYIFEAGKIDGKRKVVEKGGFETKAAAYKAGVTAYNDFLHGNIGITSESITLKDFMTSWIENVVAANVKPTTIQLYKSLTANQIRPHLGEVKVQELTPAMLDKWIRGLQKKGLSHNTLRRAHALIHHALKYAVYPAQLIHSNPADYIQVPKNAPRNIVKRTIITPERFKSLLEKYPFGTNYYIPLTILYYTGIRCGELLGLTWDNLNFKKKVLTIDKQITYLSGRGYFFSTPKTLSSEREIAIDDFLVQTLSRWKEQQQKNELEQGDSYVYNYRERNTGKLIQRSKIFGSIEKAEFQSLICARKNGQATLPFHIGHLLKKESLNSHSFRHSHATILIENGATPKSVSSRLGHSDISITQNLYTHVTEKMNEETATIFTNLMQTNS